MTRTPTTTMMIMMMTMKVTNRLSYSKQSIDTPMMLLMMMMAIIMAVMTIIIMTMITITRLQGMELMMAFSVA